MGQPAPTLHLVIKHPFSIDQGRCFAVVFTGPAGRPEHCRGEVRAHGDLIDASGKRHHWAEACAEHEGDLAQPRFRRKAEGSSSDA